MSDRGTPRTWRNMNGYGSHTFMWINEEGKRFWVKYHFKTEQGIENFSAAEAKLMKAEDPDYHRRDLHQAIARKSYPVWRLEMQIMPFERAATYRFNPFDLTKVWPHRDYPPIAVRHLVLDRNPENFFAQIEQAAFSPANMVPGIGASPDRMLLGRIFSYHDTHLHRIGTNYQQLPVNSPRSAVNSYNKDGAMRYEHSRDQPVYAPNSYGGPNADSVRFGDRGWYAEGEGLVSGRPQPRSDGDGRNQVGDRHPEPHQRARALLVLQGLEAEERRRRLVTAVDDAPAEGEEGRQRVAGERREQQIQRDEGIGRTAGHHRTPEHQPAGEEADLLDEVPARRAHGELMRRGDVPCQDDHRTRQPARHRMQQQARNPGTVELPGCRKSSQDERRRDRHQDEMLHHVEREQPLVERRHRRCDPDEGHQQPGRERPAHRGYGSVARCEAFHAGACPAG